MTTRSLVIGGNGFIGSHLTDALAAAGHEVTVFDRFASPTPRYQAAGVRQLSGDFLDEAAVAEALSGQNTVFHFLSTTNPASSSRDPLLDVATNVEPTIGMLSACVEAEVSSVYFASTGGAVYGNQHQGQYSESSIALPRSPYGIGKLTIEHYLEYFGIQFGLDSVSLRISNPYGPRQRSGARQGLIPIALAAMRSGQPVTRYGDGSMVRDYLYVEDAVGMIMSVVDAEAHEHGVYNIGSGEGHTVNEVLKALAAATGLALSIDEVEVPPTFVESVVLDTSRFSGEFGAPTLTPLSVGLERTWQSALAG